MQTLDFNREKILFGKEHGKHLSSQIDIEEPMMVFIK